MSTCEIHSIYVLNRSKHPSEIRLSNRYRTELTDGAVFVYSSADDPLLLRETRVASFTTLFGRNGSGKTSLLVDLCQTSAPLEKSKPLGILFSVGDELMLFRGRALSNWKVGQGGVAVAETKVPPEIDRIFYTTSPFEPAKRAKLARYGVLNASPSFNSGTRFDGLTLIMNSEHLAGSVAEEWKKSQIAVRGRISWEVALPEMIEQLFQRHGYESESVSTKYAASLFKRLLKGISSSDKNVLTANLKIISNIEGNANVVGRFVGELLRIASEVRNGTRVEAQMDWSAMLDLSTQVIDESGFILANGHQILDFLRVVGKALKPAEKGDSFDMVATPVELRTALESAESQFPKFARFAADLEFLKFELPGLSSGQFALLYLYSAIGSALANLASAGNSDPVFLLIDEGEMFLHPAWQREYIAGLLDFISKVTGQLRAVHVVISTHSLIVAADSPPNTLFDVEQGQTRNSFGNGPRATLDDVYGVDTFAGKYTAGMVEELLAFLRNSQAPATPRIQALAHALADTQLQKYVLDAISVRGGDRHA